MIAADLTQHPSQDLGDGLEDLDFGIVAAVPDRWSDYWQTRHHLLSRMARHVPVEWIEPPLTWRQLLGLQRVEGGDAGSGIAPPPGLRVTRASWAYPRLHRWPDAARALYRRQAAQAARRLQAQGCRRVVGYVWRPQFDTLLDLPDFDGVCYHIDDDYNFSHDETGIGPRERRLLERSRLCFVHSEPLMKSRGALSPDARFVPNGVDYGAYAEPKPMPQELRGLPRPMLGYAGWLKPQLDWDLLEAFARGNPAWSLVLVGPARSDPGTREALRRLRGLPNVHLLGGRPADRLPAYVQQFDVCLMPYRVNAYTHSINPLKLYEYMATGNPVISTPIEGAAAAASLIWIAQGADEWAECIRAALAQSGAADPARRTRSEWARARDWQRLAKQVLVSIREAVR